MCTGIRLTANGGEVFWGRTMDLAAGMFGEDAYQEIPSGIISVPKNININGTIETWQSKYAVVGMGATGTNILYDGVNEKGLAGDIQVLMECTHDSQENIKSRNQTPVLGEEFVTYVLTQFSTVQEIRDHYQEYSLTKDPIMVGDVPIQIPAHFSFIDENGDGIVLEPLNNGQFTMYEFVGTMTNSPEYDWHLKNINNYIGLNTTDVTKSKQLNSSLKLSPIESGTGYGLFGLPGDYTAVSRFVRATIIANNIDNFDYSEGINTLYGAFRSVIIPRGLEHADIEKPLTDFTRYWSGYDLSARKLYVQTGNGLAISAKEIDSSLTEITYTEVDTTNFVHDL